MAKPARKRETINSRVVYNFHPMFRDAGIRFLYGNDSVPHEPATIEGGDITVIGNRAVMVGMGERSTPQGVETLARALFAAGSVDRVIAVELPRERAFMHLDTAMTMVDRDAFSVYPYLPEGLRSFTLTSIGTGGDFAIDENADLFRAVAEALEVDRIRVLRTPIDKMGAQREQWDDGNNFLAVSPGVIFGYERNTTTNRFLADEGIQVVQVVGNELGRGRGGPRCMTCPIEREAVSDS
jgi:arginine deiminase